MGGCATKPKTFEDNEPLPPTSPKAEPTAVPEETNVDKDEEALVDLSKEEAEETTVPKAEDDGEEAKPVAEEAPKEESDNKNETEIEVTSPQKAEN